MVIDTMDGKVCSDIIWARTLPLRNFEIKVDPLEDDRCKQYESITYRFSLFDNVANVGDNPVVNFGSITITITHKKGYGPEYTAVLPMLCDQTNLLASNVVCELKENGHRVQEERITDQACDLFKELCIDGMRAFYAVQVSLLNPVLEMSSSEEGSPVEAKV